MRFEKEINIYGNEVILNRFQANETSIEVVQGKISALISESELIELENSQATMYSKLASAIMDIDSLDLQFSELNTKYNTVSGQYTELDSKLTQVEISVNGLSANISQVSQNLSDNYSTTTQINSAINAKANEITASVSGSYATKAELNTANGKISVLETWQNEASLKISDSYIISTVINSSSYQNSIDSLIEQKASSIRLKADKISWESTYSSMTEDGVFSCQDAIISGDIETNKTINNWYFFSNISEVDSFYEGENLTRGGFSVRTQNKSKDYEGKVTISPAPYPEEANYGKNAVNIIYSNRDFHITQCAEKKYWSSVILKDGYFYVKCGIGSSTKATAIAVNCSTDGMAIGQLNGTWYLPAHLRGGVLDRTTEAPNVWMSDKSTQYVSRCSSSSKRYKKDITDIDDELNPELLYDLPVRSFTYKSNHIPKTDRNYGKRMIGFIAEEVEEVYPKACQYNEDGTVEMWNSQILIPAMLALIQKQHKEIEKLKTTFGMNTLA